MSGESPDRIGYKLAHEAAGRERLSVRIRQLIVRRAMLIDELRRIDDILNEVRRELSAFKDHGAGTEPPT
jgi:hypothetical protein